MAILCNCLPDRCSLLLAEGEMVLSNAIGANAASRFPWLRPSGTYGSGAAGSTERPPLGRPLGTHFDIHAVPRPALRPRSVMPSVESVLLALGNLDSDDEDLPPAKVARSDGQPALRKPLPALTAEQEDRRLSEPSGRCKATYED